MPRAAQDMASGRTLIYMGCNSNSTIAVADDLPRADFAGLAQFNLAVDSHFATGDQNLSGATARAQPHEF